MGSSQIIVNLKGGLQWYTTGIYHVNYLYNLDKGINTTAINYPKFSGTGKYNNDRIDL
jgi:hypothetical protein